MAQDALMTATAVGQALGVSSSTVRRLAESGELPAAQKLPGPNGPYLFEPAEVELYLRERQVKAARAS